MKPPQQLNLEFHEVVYHYMRRWVLCHASHKNALQIRRRMLSSTVCRCLFSAKVLSSHVTCWSPWEKLSRLSPISYCAYLRFAQSARGRPARTNISQNTFGLISLFLQWVPSLSSPGKNLSLPWERATPPRHCRSSVTPPKTSGENLLLLLDARDSLEHHPSIQYCLRFGRYFEQKTVLRRDDALFSGVLFEGDEMRG